MKIGILLCLVLLMARSVQAACNSPSNAPCTGTGVRTIIVDGANGPGTTYTTFQPALDNAAPGDNIRIKPGNYSFSGNNPKCGLDCFALKTNGTQANPILIQAFDPANPPVIRNDLYIGSDTPVVGGRWTILDGITFTSTNSDGAGARVLASNVRVVNNKFTNNKFQGMWLDNSDILVEDNEFSDNGSQGNGVGCMGDWDENAGTPDQWDPSHCHGIYGGGITPVSGPTSCTTPHHVTIRRNVFRNNGGSGFQQYINPNTCADPTWGRKAHDYLIENNQFVNNGMGFFIAGMASSTIRNNTIIQTAYPAQDPNRSVGMIEHSDTPSTLKFYNNLYVTPLGRPSDTTLYVVTQQTFADRLMDFNYNVYHTFHSTTPNLDTRFRGDWKTCGGGTVECFLAFGSFFSQWKATSQKDVNALVLDYNATPPLLVNQAGGNYRLTSTSPARGAALQSECPTEDFDKNGRTDGDCDAGAFEYGSVAQLPIPPRGGLGGKSRIGGKGKLP